MNCEINVFTVNGMPFKEESDTTSGVVMSLYPMVGHVLSEVVKAKRILRMNRNIAHFNIRWPVVSIHDLRKLTTNEIRYFYILIPEEYPNAEIAFEMSIKYDIESYLYTINNHTDSFIDVVHAGELKRKTVIIEAMRARVLFIDSIKSR